MWNKSITKTNDVICKKTNLEKNYGTHEPTAIETQTPDLEHVHIGCGKGQWWITTHVFINKLIKNV